MHPHAFRASWTCVFVMMQSSLIGCYYRLSWGVKPCHCFASIVCPQINSAKTWICFPANAVRLPQSGLFRAGSRGQYLQHNMTSQERASSACSSAGSSVNRAPEKRPACLRSWERPQACELTQPWGFHLLWGNLHYMPSPSGLITATDNARIHTHTHTHTWWYPAGVCPKWVAKTNYLKAIAAEYVCN